MQWILRMRKLFTAKGASIEGAIHRIAEGNKDRAGSSAGLDRLPVRAHLELDLD